MRIAPEFKENNQSDDDEADLNQTGPVEVVEGSTARAVAAAVDMYSAELLNATQQLMQLQTQLDEQHEGCATRPAFCFFWASPC